MPVKEVWRDNIGSLSRTARLGERDIQAIAEEMALKVSTDRIHDIMLGIAEAHKQVLAIEVEHQGSVRMLLVNTGMSA